MIDWLRTIQWTDSVIVAAIIGVVGVVVKVLADRKKAPGVASPNTPPTITNTNTVTVNPTFHTEVKPEIVVQVFPTADDLESTFESLEEQIPELLAEMRKDLADHPLARELVILNKSCIYNSDPNKVTLCYYFEDHPDLRNKLRILENHGLIEEITYNNTDRFVMEEALVAYLSVQAK
jgi:hypothetical protein